VTASGGEAVVSTGDVSDWAYGEQLVRTAVDSFGRLDALVNNAGLVRDRMLVNMSEDEWDLVLKVDLKGHFVPLRHAAAYWREQSKAGTPIAARVVNTSSGAGLLGSVGQGNYCAAKAGVLAARTPMTEAVFAQTMAKPESGFDPMDPANVSPLVVWLASAECEVTGRTFEVEAGKIGIADGWQHGPTADRGDRWPVTEIGAAVDTLLAQAPEPAPVYGSQ
jgi:NAD(P)-dependent dehydrogenase (short-subunit alcohol dehydrogenase family)